MPTTLITGTNRGLGLEFVKQYSDAGWEVIACCRNPDTADDLNALAKKHAPHIAVEQLEMTDHAQIEALAAKYEGRPIDVLINNAGYMGDRDASKKVLGQGFGDIDYAMWDRVMKTNVFGPMRVAECFVDNVAQSDARKLINIGSTVGSIQGRKVPAFVYSSSKTALHKVTNLLAGVLKDRNIVVAGVCPGRAKTHLGGPGAMIEVDDSVRGMRAVIDGLTMDQAGWLLRYTGDVVPW